MSLGWSKGSLLPPADSPTQIRRTLRWFTPKNEVPLCGHATLASSFALLTHLRKSNDEEQEIQEIKFESKFRGTLTASLETIENEQYVTLNFPANKTEAVEGTDKAQIRDIFLGPNFTSDDITDVRVCDLENLVFVRIRNNGDDPEVRIKQVEPDYEQMLGKKFNKTEILGSIVTIQGDGNDNRPDFYSRFFGPGFGIREDPVTGLAHTILIPYWTGELGQKPGIAFMARQASARGGDMRCKLNGERVSLSGRGRVAVIGNLKL